MIEVVRLGSKSNATVVRIVSASGGGVVSVGSSSGGTITVPVSSGTGSRDGERWWQGVGDPPDVIVGSRPGDWYWDTESGDVYELTEGL